MSYSTSSLKKIFVRGKSFVTTYGIKKILNQIVSKMCAKLSGLLHSSQSCLLKCHAIIIFSFCIRCNFYDRIFNKSYLNMKDGKIIFIRQNQRRNYWYETSFLCAMFQYQKNFISIYYQNEVRREIHYIRVCINNKF